MLKRVATICCLLATTAFGQNFSGDDVRLVVGRSTAIPYSIASVRCDDASLIKLSLSADETTLLLTAVRPGRTHCSYGQAELARVVFELEIVSIEEAMAPLATKIVGLAVERLYTHGR